MFNSSASKLTAVTNTLKEKDKKKKKKKAVTLVSDSEDSDDFDIVIEKASKPLL